MRFDVASTDILRPFGMLFELCAKLNGASVNFWARVDVNAHLTPTGSSTCVSTMLTCERAFESTESVALDHLSDSVCVAA